MSMVKGAAAMLTESEVLGAEKQEESAMLLAVVDSKMLVQQVSKKPACRLC